MWEDRTADERRTVKAEIAAVERELSRCQALHDSLYQRLVEGILTRQEYSTLKSRYQTRSSELSERLEQLKVQSAELTRCGPDNPMLTAYRALQNVDVLTEDLIHTVISRIEVHEDNRLDIFLAYQDEFQTLTHFVEGEKEE